MFNFSNFLSRMVPSIKNEDVNENIINIRNEIIENTLPVIIVCQSDISETDLLLLKEDKYINTMTHSLVRHCPNIKSKADIFSLFLAVCENTHTVLNALLPLTDKYFTETVDKDSLSYPRLQVLGIIENAMLISKYIRKYCRYLVAILTAKKNGTDINKLMNKANLDFINENFVEFLKACSVLDSYNKNNIKAKLDSIPDVTVTEDGKEAKMFNERKLDPSGAINGFLSARWNPFFWIGMKIVDFQHNRYTQAKEEATSLKLEIDFMNSIIGDNGGDAALEIQVKKAKERLDKVEYQIHKYEEKAMNTKY